MKIPSDLFVTVLSSLLGQRNKALEVSDSAARLGSVITTRRSVVHAPGENVLARWASVADARSAVRARMRQTLTDVGQGSAPITVTHTHPQQDVTVVVATAAVPLLRGAS